MSQRDWPFRYGLESTMDICTSNEFGEVICRSAADENDGFSFGGMLSWIGDHLLVGIILIAGITLLVIATEIVGEKHARIVERLGKFHRVMHAGLRFRIPFIDKVIEEMELWIVDLTENIKVKTSDNVFVTLPVTVQYRVQQDKVKEAYYELEDPEAIITGLVLNEVKSTSAAMRLEDIFSSRDRIEIGVKEMLEERLGAYGYEIVNVVVDNPELSGELEQSYNNVMAAMRLQEAATAEAAALRIKAVGEATANADGLKINAEAQVAYRDTIAAGNAAAIQTMTEGTDLSAQAALHYFMVTDSNDAIRDAAGKGATVVVSSPNPSDKLLSVLTD